MANNYLIHFGIPEMKWHHRRFQYEDGSLTPAGRIRYGKGDKDTSDSENSVSNESKPKTQEEINAEEIKSRKNDIKNTRALSIDEINQKIDRLKKESELKRLTAENIAPGKAMVNKILMDAGTKVLTSAAVGALTYAGKYAMTKEYDAKDAANYIFANPNKKK